MICRVLFASILLTKTHAQTAQTAQSLTTTRATAQRLIACSDSLYVRAAAGTALCRDATNSAPDRFRLPPILLLLLLLVVYCLLLVVLLQEAQQCFRSA
jgi:hypothetical protein